MLPVKVVHSILPPANCLNHVHCLLERLFEEETLNLAIKGKGDNREQSVELTLLYAHPSAFRREHAGGCISNIHLLHIESHHKPFSDSRLVFWKTFSLHTPDSGVEAE